MGRVQFVPEEKATDTVPNPADFQIHLYLSPCACAQVLVHTYHHPSIHFLKVWASLVIGQGPHCGEEGCTSSPPPTHILTLLAFNEEVHRAARVEDAWSPSPTPGVPSHMHPFILQSPSLTDRPPWKGRWCYGDRDQQSPLCGSGS